MTHRLRSLAALLGATALLACGENAVRDITGPLPEARVKFHNFGIGSPGVNFYAGDRKLTAVFSSTGTESTTGTLYGAVAAGGFYTAVDPGQYTLHGRIAAEADKDLAISSVPVTLEAGKAYSFFQSGVYSSAAKTVDAFVVEDPIPTQIDYDVAHVRFVNASANADPLTLTATPTDAETGAAVVIGGPVAYKSAGAFTEVPEGSYTVAARAAEATTDAVRRVNVQLEGGRVYTITLRGDMTISSTGTAANRPLLDVTANR